jgi:hypothetical protein
MLNLFKSLSNKKIILISILLLLLMAGVVVLYAFNLLNEPIFLVIMFVLLMTFSTFTSQLWQRHFQKKLDNKRKGKVYTYSQELELENPLKHLKANYGTIDLYLEDKTLYTLISIDNAEEFFATEKQVKYNVDKKKYDKLIQFYVFDEKDNHLFRKIIILNYQAKNFYVGSFIVNKMEKTIYQTDKVAPNEEYNDIYQNFLKLLNVNVDQN